MNLTKNQALDLLRQRIREVGSQKAFALHVWVSEPYLSDVLQGRRPLGEKILRELRLEVVTVTTYRRVEPEAVEQRILESIES